MNNSATDTPLRAAPPFSEWVGYVVAVAAVAVATLVRLALDTALGDNYPFATYFGAVVVVAWFGRTLPAVVTLVLGGLLADYLFVRPRYSLAATDTDVLLGMSLYFTVAAVVVAMSHAMRRAASAEADQKERLRITLASIGDAVISTDADGTVTYLNAVAESLTGWTHADAVGVPLTTVFRIVNESTRLPVENPAMRALKEGVIVGLANHTVLIARDGTERPIDDSAAPIRNKDGEVVGCVLVFRDISEKKRFEGERREAQERVVATLESITDAFTRFDRDWRIVYVNSEAERLTGQHRSELLGRSHWDAFPTTVGTPLEAEYRRAVAERVTIEFEHYFPPLGRWFAVKGDPTPDGGLAVFFRDITDRKRAENVLRQSEARFRAGIEAVSSIVWTNDPQGMMAGEQVGWGKFTGQDRESYQGHGWFRAVHPDDAQPTLDAWHEAVAGKTTFVFEHRVRRSDGQWRLCSIRAVPVLDDRGEVGEWVGVHTDITDQKRAEGEIVRLAAESERQRRLYETVLTNTPDFIYVFSLDHQVIYANDALIKMWGRGHDGAIGKTFLEIGYEPWHAEMHDREIDEVRATKQSIRGEVPFTGTHGRRMYDYIFVPVLGADGEVEAVAGTTRDVTERKAIEQELREGREQLDFALAAADLGQWSLNLADHTTRRTLRHDQLFGYAALLPEWTYETFLEHVVPDDRAAVDAGFQKAVATGSAWAVECRIRRADGAVRHIWTKALVRRDAGGQVERMLGIVGDVTDRRLAEAALRRSEERLRLALNAARMVAWDYEPATGVVVTSDNAPDVYGFPSGEGVRNLEWGLTLIHPDDVAHHRETLAAAAATGEGFTSHFRMVRQDTGTVQWMEERGLAVRDQAGMTVRLVGVNMDITARKRAEDTLRASEERSAFVRRSTGVGFWYCDLPFDVLQWDELVKAHFHLPPDAAVTIRTFYDRLHPDDQERTRRAIERSIGSRTPYDTEYRTVASDTGAVKWVRAIGRTFYATDGTPTRFDGVTLDVSDRKRAEADRERLLRQLEEERGRLAEVFRQAPAFLCVVRGPDHVFELANDRYYQLVGQRDILGKSVRETFPEVEEQGFIALLDGVYATGEPFVGTGLRLQFEQAGERYVDFVYHPLRDPDGTVAGVVVVGIDVTDRERRQAEREATERTLATLVERCPFGIYIMDADFRMANVNRGSQEGAFRNVRPLVGRPFEEVMRIIWPDSVAAEVIGKFRHTLDTGEPYRSTDFVNPRADIDQVEGYEWELHRLTLPDGRAGVVCYYYDSTRLRQVEQALRDADRRKDEFLATLAHELRNPLAPIRNGLQVIRMAGANGTVEQARSMMDRQLTQLVRLVDDLLDVSRVTSGKLELRKERIELKAVIDAAVETSRPAIEQAGHDFAVVVPDEPIFVDGDHTRLAQVVSNLLNNSTKYTHRGGHIRLSVGREDERAVVSVTDDGIGLPPAMLEKVFGMFAQVDRTLEKTTGGLGIGLSLVKGLVEMHGGTIEARSEGEGKGSEFVVRLPVVSASVGGADQPNGQAEEVVPSGRRRVLVVDDNVDAADSLAQLLELLGNEVRTANDGEAGVAAAGEFRPDVVLMDIGMPVLNGYEACRRIREQPWGRNMVLVALTGWGQDDDRRKTAEAGFDSHMVKPVEFAALTKLLAGLEAVKN